MPPKARELKEQVTQEEGENYNTRGNKTGKNPASSSRQGSHKKPTTGASFKPDQERAERAEEEQPTPPVRKTAASRTKAGEAVGSKTIQAPKDKKNSRGREASKIDTGNRAATYGPPIQGNLIDDSKDQVSIQGKPQDETGEPGNKEERRTPHLEDNRSTAPRLDVPGR